MQEPSFQVSPEEWVQWAHAASNAPPRPVEPGLERPQLVVRELSDIEAWIHLAADNGVLDRGTVTGELLSAFFDRLGFT